VLTAELQSALPDRYRVLREIGRGGMATVYLAEDVPHGRNVAVKVLSPELGSSIDAERFRREIQIAARLSHPNILPAYDSGSANGIYYYVMPFVEGESVRARIDRESQLPIEDAIAITCEVCDALAYAHAQGVVHRDIKPENILLQNGHAVVADFGIARMVQEGGEKLTQTGMSIGTAQYMSPEQFSGEKVDGRSDVYAVACVLYEMLVGEPPFNGPNAMAIMARASMQPVPSVRLVRSSVPEPVELALVHAMEKVPADRFASVAEFKEALLGGAGTASFHRRTPVYTPAYTAAYTSAYQTPPVPVWRRPAALVGAGALALAVGAGVVWNVQRSREAAVAALGAEAKRVGVLYFADASNDGSLQHIADGLTESLIDELDRVPTLEVMSRNAVRPFRGSEVASDSIYRALRVGTIVRGELVPGGRRARLTVQLVDAVSGEKIKGASFDVDTTRALAASGELATRVAEFLRSEVGLDVKLKESRLRASNPQAWTLVQRAEKRLKDADSLIVARQAAAALPVLESADADLARAVAIDAQWAQPWVSRAAVAYQRARAHFRERPGVARAVLDSGTVYANRALAIDPRSADAHELRGKLAFGHLEMRTVPEGPDWDAYLERGERDLREAGRLNPQQATAYETLSRLLYWKKQPAEALTAARFAYEADAYLLNAREILGRLFFGYFDANSYTDARRWCDEGHRRFPRDLRFVQCSLWAMTMKGGTPDPDEAWRLVRTVDSLAVPARREYEGRIARTLLGGVLGKAGLRDSADRVLVRARAGTDVDPDQEIIGREIVMRLIYGDHDKAITLLADYLQVHPDHRKGLANQTAWYWSDPKVQNDPRFQRLMAGTR